MEDSYRVLLATVIGREISVVATDWRREVSPSGRVPVRGFSCMNEPVVTVYVQM